MTHSTRTQHRTLRRVVMHGSESTTPGVVEEYGEEWAVVFDKCGVIDKAGDSRSAEARAARHEKMPHR